MARCRNARRCRSPGLLPQMVSFAHAGQATSLASKRSAPESQDSTAYVSPALHMSFVPPFFVLVGRPRGQALLGWRRERT
jgi:hypothetical protein